MEEQIQEPDNMKAGARHNNTDKQALQSIFDAVLKMGADATPKDIAFPDLWGEVLNNTRALYEAKVAEIHGEDVSPYTEQKAMDIGLEHHEYGTSQIELPVHVGLTNQGWLLQHADPNVILELEGEAHVTLRYGLDRSEWEQVAKVASETKPFKVTVGELGMFEKEDKDVIFLHTVSPALQKLGNQLSALPLAKENTYPKYTPHITIGYMVKGTAEKLLALDHPLTGVSFEIDKVELKDGETDEEMCVMLGEQLPDPEVSYTKLMDALRDAVRVVSGKSEGWVADYSQTRVIFTPNYVDGFYRAEYAYTVDNGEITATISGEWEPVKEDTRWVAKAPVDVSLFNGDGNALKSIVETDDYWVLGNHVLLYDSKDLEGILTDRVNRDGSRQEYFTKETNWKSAYTDTGFLYMDFQHGMDKDPITPKRDDILGWVDMKGAVETEYGLFARRVLNLQNKYVQFLKKMVDEGLVILGTSTEPVQRGVRKAADGQILQWPLYRDSLVVTPMEPRNIIDNRLENIPADIKSFMESLLNGAAGELADSEGQPGGWRLKRVIKARQGKARLHSKF